MHFIKFSWMMAVMLVLRLWRVTQSSNESLPTKSCPGLSSLWKVPELQCFSKKYNILKNISYNNVLNNCLLNNLYIKVKDCSLYNKMKGNFNSKYQYLLEYWLWVILFKILVQYDKKLNVGTWYVNSLVCCCAVVVL